jgi:Cellulose biosynthesis protein BcsS
MLAFASEPAAAHESAAQQAEFSVGAEASRQAWSIYSGVTVAPFGALSEDGLRLRTTGGYGAFRYSGLRASGGSSELVKFRGTVSFADLLLGYHRQLGPLTLKLYAGAMATRHAIDPFDAEAEVQGAGVGGKVAVETWWTISDMAWTQLDVSYGTLHESYAGRLRFGWRVVPVLSAGVEAFADGNVDGRSGRIGGFLRYEWAQGEVSASGGLMTDWADVERIDARGGYATISWLNRF